MKCVVIDDSEDAIEILQTNIKKRDDLTLSGSFLDSIQALNFVSSNEVDLIFLDIDMPDLNGLEFMEILRSKKETKSMGIILVTGYETYALKGYEYGVIDFIMKPVSFKRFNQAVQRFADTIEKNKIANTGYNDFFFADVDGIKTRIDCNDIVYLESAGNYVTIYKEGKRILTLKSLNDFEKILNPKNFIRVQKSFIVAIKKIDAVIYGNINIKYNGELVQISIGRMYKDELKERLRLS